MYSGVLLCINVTFAHFSRTPVGLFSRSWLGARRGAACTPRRKFGSRAGSVARALGAKSREIWQVVVGSLSAELEPSKTMESHISAFFRFLCSTAVQARSHGTTLASSFPRCYSHGHYV